MVAKWTLENIPPQAGKVAVITGANRGLGLEIAHGLASAGASLVLACRDTKKGAEAAQNIRARFPKAQIEVMEVDLGDLASIRRFAQSFRTDHPKLDILCNNASAILVPRLKTRDGFEMHIGTNLLGTFALTGLLLDPLRAAGAARIVNTSSMAHKMNKGLDLDDLHFERTPYKDMEAYGRSKLATLLFTFELDRRLKKSDVKVISVAAHPGWSNTNPDKGSFMMRLMNSFFAQPPGMGALPALYAATAADVAGGDYIGPGGFQELGGYPKRVGCDKKARDAEKAAKLWDLSEKLTGVRYLLQ